MKRWIAGGLVALLTVQTASAVVFINEVFINPPGSADDDFEFVELAGAPGKQLDGYAIALVSGGEQRFYPLNSIPPIPGGAPEIDEFFSLDGLQLGPNGLLLVGIGFQSDYGQLLPDTNFQRWDDLWNGYRDTPGKLQNDGSNTILLIRNRPGATEATHPDPPTSPDLLWGKDVRHDVGVYRPVTDPQDGIDKDQWGNGAIDKENMVTPEGFTMRDLRGAATPGDLSDDLEIVDEVSYEHERGWEYDFDSRTVDLGSPFGGLPERKVHALDDPQGFNPDLLVRVDYRTSGPGWPPAPGATGPLPNGNNWQDTATEQWIRGETANFSSGIGSQPYWYLANVANPNPDAVQPYSTQVPLWLDDGVAPDYDFTMTFTYQVLPGRPNALAVPFIPGDTDRDGDCDPEDISKLAAVFGDDDWIFSNSYAAAPEGKDGDPATQTRPWDVDATGADGIEASDLQWTLNFQGDTTGQIVGRFYDDLAATTGVVLNPNAGVEAAVMWNSVTTCGRPLDGLFVGDEITVTVYGEVSVGADPTPGSENGIMQFVQDVLLGDAGVAEVTGVTPAAPFVTTREALQTPLGIAGDEGLALINGYTTAFDTGLLAPAPLYELTLRVIGRGNTSLSVAPAATAKFAASTPTGLKLGHTASHGDPAAASYPSAVALAAVLPADVDDDGQLTTADLDALGPCQTGPDMGLGGGCSISDVDCDNDVDLRDLALIQSVVGGAS